MNDQLPTPPTPLWVKIIGTIFITALGVVVLGALVLLAKTFWTLALG